MKFATTILLALLLSSCAYRVEKESEPTTKLNANALGFSEVQAAILGPKCSRCHGWVANYEDVVANLTELSARVQSGDPGFMMPPPGRGTLSADEKAALQGWIDRGAPRLGDGSAPSDPTPSPITPPPPAPPVPAPPGLNFAQVQEKVLTPKCARCHGGMMSSYENVVANLTEIESRVRSTFDFEQMPPSRAPQLTEEEKNLLLDWIKAGAPQNNEEEGSPPPAPPPPPDDNCEEDDDQEEDDDHEEGDLTITKKCERK